MGADVDSIEIRPLGPQDLALLCATPPDVFDDSVNPEWAAAFLADPSNLILVALDRGVICGMVTATKLGHPDKPSQLFINEVGVHSDWQGRGVGRRLMTAILAEGRAKGASTAWVLTEAGNTAARALYRGTGGAETEALVMYEWEFDDG
jgi:ribosomal protein S18 acetylase RimI-like enzyme